MKKNRIWAGVLLGTCVIVFGGCSSAKGNGRPIFEIEESAEQSYEMTVVNRGTVKKTGILSASYAQTKQEKLRFGVAGKRISACYVEVGSTVKKGDLLAELLLEDEEAEIADMEYSINLKTMQIRQYEEQRDFQLTALEKKKWKYTTKEYEDKLEELKQEYDYKIEDLSDEIVILQLQYEQLKKTIEGGRLYAGIDGTVLKMSGTKGYYSDTESDFITISDSTVCAFQGYGSDLIDCMTIGQMYTFHTSDKEKEYTVKLVSIDTTMGLFTFELPEPDYTIPLGQRVLLDVVKEERNNALYLPNKAVHMANNSYYVYYIDAADGVRKMKEVKIGLVGDNDTEILEGLSEGDEVILQ